MSERKKDKLGQLEEEITLCKAHITSSEKKVLASSSRDYPGSADTPNKHNANGSTSTSALSHSVLSDPAKSEDVASLIINLRKLT